MAGRRAPRPRPRTDGHWLLVGQRNVIGASRNNIVHCGKVKVSLNDYNVIRAMGDALGSLEKWEDSEPLVPDVHALGDALGTPNRIC